METRRHGDKETWRHGDMETGDMETWRHGDMDMEIKMDMETQNLPANFIFLRPLLSFWAEISALGNTSLRENRD
jgi:hypothetical protein